MKTPSTLDEYESYAVELIEHNSNMDETNTKNRLITKLIPVLGWTEMGDCKLEYALQMGSTKKHVDYSLSVDSNPSVFIEAKAVRSNLSDDNRKQLKSYMKQKKVNWGLLTNGRKYEIMHRYDNHENTFIKIICSISVSDLTDKRSLSNILFKESIINGKSKRKADKIQEMKKSKEILKNNKNKLVKDTTQVVTDEVGEVINVDIESEAINFIESVINKIGKTSENDDKSTERENSNKSQYDYGIKLKNGSIIPPKEEKKPSNHSQADHMTEIVNYLISEYDLLDYIEIPYVPPQSRNCLINDEKEHPDGSEMRGPRELTQGFFLHTALSIETKKNQIKSLTKSVGLDIDDIRL